MARPTVENKREPDSPAAVMYVQVTSIHNGQVAISGATNASPIVIHTTSSHVFSTGDLVHITGVGGNTAANGEFTITVVDTDHFSLDGSTGNASYTSGGIVTLAQPVRVKWLKWTLHPSGGLPADYVTFSDELPIGNVDTAGQLTVGNRIAIIRRTDSRRWEPVLHQSISPMQLAVVTDEVDAGSAPDVKYPTAELSPHTYTATGWAIVKVLLLKHDDSGSAVLAPDLIGSDWEASKVLAYDIRKDGSPLVGDIVRVFRRTGKAVLPGEAGIEFASSVWTSIAGFDHIYCEELDATDYLRGLADIEPEDFSVLVKDAATGAKIGWYSLDDFATVIIDTGGGGGGGTTYTAGYAIDITGTTIDNDPTEWSGFDQSHIQIFVHTIIAGAPARTDPNWVTPTNRIPNTNQYVGLDATGAWVWFPADGTVKFGRVATPIGAALNELAANWGNGTVRFQDPTTGILAVAATGVKNKFIGQGFVKDAQVAVVGGVVIGGTCAAVSWSNT